MIYKISIFFVIALLIGALLFFREEKEKEGYQREVHYIGFANEIEDSFFKEMKKEHQLIPAGSGGRMMSLIEGWNIVFQSNKELTLDQARILFVDVILKLQNKINGNKQVRPYLEEYPISILASKVSISFKKSTYVDPPYIALMFLSRGRICYSMNDNEKKEFINDYAEPLSEAIEIYKKAKKTSPNAP